jgi:hypothetical protein
MAPKKQPRSVALLEVVREAIGDGGDLSPLATQFLGLVAESGADPEPELLWLAGRLESAIKAAAEVQGQVDERGRRLGAELPSLVARLRECRSALAVVVKPEGVDPVDELQQRRTDRQSGTDSAGAAAKRANGGRGGRRAR